MTTYYKTTSDIINSALASSFEPTDGTSEYQSRALEFANRAQRNLVLGGGEFAPQILDAWDCFKSSRKAVIILQPATSGSITLTNNSPDGLFNPSISQDLTEWFIQMEGEKEWYTIGYHSQKIVALDSVYIGDSGAKAFTAIKLKYRLQNDVARINSRIYTLDGYIDVVGEEELEISYPLRTISKGTPKKAAMVGGNYLQFSHYVEELTRVEYNYVVLPSDLSNVSGEQPAIPLQYRHIMADMVAFYILLEKGSQKASTLATLITATIASMSGNSRKGKSKSSSIGRIFPRGRLK